MLVALGVCGYWLLFTQFMVYDDEGYVLWSLHNYFQEGGLYTRVYSQYGPFIYTLYHGIHTLFGLAFDHVTGRLITLFYWLGAVVLAGLFVWRQTRSAITTSGTLVLTFAGLIVMTNEPIHPGGILTFLSALGGVGGACALGRGQTRLFALLCGAIGAAMLLTKINVGVFFLVSAGSWMALGLSSTKLARVCLWLAALGSLLVPFLLMNKLWPDPWVAIFALAFALSALSLLWLIQATPRHWFGGKSWMGFIGAALAIMVIVLGATWLRGTGLAALWHGIVLAPLGQPNIFEHQVFWPALVPWLALGLFALVIVHQARQRAWIIHLVAILRLLLVIGFFASTYLGIENSYAPYSFLYGLPFVWLMVVPLGPVKSATLHQAKLWLTWVFIWQTLHAYPVAGSQMSWGSFLWVPLAMVGCHEALNYLTGKMGLWGRGGQNVSGGVFATASILLLLHLGYVGGYRYFTGQSLGLTGGKNLRISDKLAGAYRIIDKNVRLHGGSLFSYPGMFSFNLWTGHPTPTPANVTHWFSLLSVAQQQAIIDKLQADDRAVIVVQNYLVKLLIEHGHPPQGILERYLMQNFRPVFRIDSFEFWAKNGRPITSISTARWHPAEGNMLAAMELVTAAEGQSGSIEIRGLYYPHNTIVALPVSPIRPWQVTPLHPDNSPAGPMTLATTQVSLQGLSQIIMPLGGLPPLPALNLLEIIIKDPSGKILDSLRFAD
ncbi:MAG: hypothetical protein K9M98_04425 [Cephaloticoccus sp.]|nr:hypothetical protein [Cephaloticoccus sp.]